MIFLLSYVINTNFIMELCLFFCWCIRNGCIHKGVHTQVAHVFEMHVRSCILQASEYKVGGAVVSYHRVDITSDTGCLRDPPFFSARFHVTSPSSTAP